MYVMDAELHKQKPEGRVETQRHTQKSGNLIAMIFWLASSLHAKVCLQDKFFSQLRSSADGFSVIADFFGRGLLNNSSVSLNAQSGL